VTDDSLHLTLGAMPAIVRARLSAGLAAHEHVLLDDGRAHRASRPHAAHAVYVTEWPHADDAGEPRGASVFLLDPGVTPPAAQLTRGSTAWLPLDADADDVIGAAYAVIRGLAVVSPVVLPNAGASRERSARREPRVVQAAASGEDEPHLTERELQVLRLLAEGLGNKQIGAQLGISASTVKYHLQAVFTKLGVRTRSEAVSYGLRSGVVPL
jgi:two-component system, NarL family, nitrate/nitrite response regulator NarL